MSSFAKTLIIVAITIFLSACWDRVELEERGFVAGVGISLLSDERKAEEAKIKEEGLIGDKAIEMTYQFVQPAGLTSPTQGGGDQQAFINLSAIGETPFDITRDFVRIASRSPYFEHLKIIIISEEVAKTPNLFSNLLDFFLRDNEMRRRTKVLVAKDPMKILETDPGADKMPVMYIESLTENGYKNQSIVNLNRIGDVHERLLANQSYILQKATTKENRTLLDGAAVFTGNDNKMVGSLTNKEVAGVNFLLGEVKGGIIKAEYNGAPVVFDIRRATSKISGNLQDKESMHFTYEIEIEAYIEESFVTIKAQDLDQEKKLEDAAEAEVKKVTEMAIEKSKELNAEVIGLSQYMHRKHFATWDEISNDWDVGKNYFQKAQIDVQVTVNSHSTGTIYKSSN